VVLPPALITIAGFCATAGEIAGDTGPGFFRRTGLFTGNRTDDCPFPAGIDIEFQEDNLLPGTAEEIALLQGNGEGRADQGGFDMRAAIAIPPLRVMGIGQILRGNPGEGAPEIGKDAGFVLDHGQGRRGVEDKKVDKPRPDGTVQDSFFDIAGDIDDVSFPFRCNFQDCAEHGSSIVPLLRPGKNHFSGKTGWEVC